MEINIIGGADGPTAIFIASDVNPYVIASIVIFCVALLGIIIWTRIKKRKQ